ncbi:MAG: hypothetical protein P4L83_17750 [Nevskia sp.]|nr:hypothetical protein [Nevskia sp.]
MPSNGVLSAACQDVICVATGGTTDPDELPLDELPLEEVPWRPPDDEPLEPLELLEGLVAAPDVEPLELLPVPEEEPLDELPLPPDKEPLELLDEPASGPDALLVVSVALPPTEQAVNMAAQRQETTTRLSQCILPQSLHISTVSICLFSQPTDAVRTTMGTFGQQSSCG